MEHFVVIADPELRRTIESSHHMDKPGAEQEHSTTLCPSLTLTHSTYSRNLAVP